MVQHVRTTRSHSGVVMICLQGLELDFLCAHWCRDAAVAALTFSFAPPLQSAAERGNNMHWCECVCDTLDAGESAWCCVGRLEFCGRWMGNARDAALTNHCHQHCIWLLSSKDATYHPTDRRLCPVSMSRVQCNFSFSLYLPPTLSFAFY